MRNVLCCLDKTRGSSSRRVGRTLLRIGAVVVRNTHRIRFLLSSTCPHQDLFRTVACRLDSS